MNASQRRKQRRSPKKLTQCFIMDIESFSPYDIMAFRSDTGITTIFSRPGDPSDTYISALTFKEKEAA